MTEEKKTELLKEGLQHLGEPVTKELRQFAERMLRGYLWRGKKEKRHIRRYMCSLCGAEFESDDRDPDDIYRNQTEPEDRPLIEMFWTAWKEEMQRRRNPRAKTA